MASLSPFYEVDGDTDGGILAIVAITGSLLSLSTLILRFFVLRGLHTLRSYDYALLLAFALLLVQTALSMHAARLGVGKHRSSVGLDQIQSIEQVQYAIWLLAILVTGATRLCICLFVGAINAFSSIRTANAILLGLNIANSAAVFFATSFRCPLPTPWVAASPDTCSAAISIYSYMIGSSMAFYAAIYIVAVAMIVRVQTDVKTKSIVIALFSYRMLCVATSITALLQPNHVYNDNNTEFTYLGLNPLVWLTVTCHLSVITACVPTLKPLFDSLLGNTMGLKIDGLYELQQRSDGQGFHVAEVADPTRTDGSASSSWKDETSSKISSKIAPRLGKPATMRTDKGTPTRDGIVCPLRLHSASHSLESHAECFAGGIGPKLRDKRAGSESTIAQKTGRNQSESVKGLKDEVIMVRDDVEVHTNNRDDCSDSS